jgi:BirA family biotin operon repressor/biotin-[acetyl-CoA-carboxylase] ligase
MHVLKFDTVDSTNNLLKLLCREQDLDDFTVVVAENQTNGRGQMGANWHSEPGKNLTFSLLVKSTDLTQNGFFSMSAAVSLAIVLVLEHYNIGSLSVKWPNDILSGRYKIGGILIENILHGSKSWSVIGIGLNVNQKQFSGTYSASSLLLVSGRAFNKNEVMQDLLTAIKLKINELNQGASSLLNDYNNKLFKKDVVAVFSSEGATFNGIIRGVSEAGELLVETDEGIKTYKFKEVKMHY